jgi:DNA-binding IclR family transcriptional regulator
VGRHLVQSVVRAFDILSAFSAERPALSVAEVAALLKLSRPTVHRLLATLQESGAVMQQDGSHRYVLSAQIVRFSNAFHQQSNIVLLAQPHLTALRDVTGETSGLHLLEGSNRVVIAQVESREDLRLTYPTLGEAIPVHLGAPGKAMLAFRTPRQIEQYLARHKLEAATPHSITSSGQLRVELARIREAGYAISHQERRLGVVAIAAPLFAAEAVVGSVNISGPDRRLFDKKVQRRMAEHVVATAREISFDLQLLGAKHKGR